MKKMLLLLAVLAFSSATASAQNPSTRGKDFWCTFLEVADISYSDIWSIVVTTENPCSVTVTNPYTNWSQTISMSANSSQSISIPRTQGYTNVSEQISHNGLHVTASDSITLFVVTHENQASMDVANVIPTDHLRSEYMVQTFPTNRYSSIFSIVATEANTNVDIILNGQTLGGTASGSTLHVNLPNAGDVYTVKGPTTGNLSGTRIIAQGGKRIGVFNGNVCVYIPTYSGYGCSCDHVVEQSTPTEFWGSEFVVAGSGTDSYKDYVLVTSLDNNCQVRVNGNLVSTLTSGGTYQYEMSSTSAVDHIETSGPAIVNLFFPTTYSYGNGDPSMTTISPLLQTVKKVQFDAIQINGITSHQVNIICRTPTTSHIRLDGNPVTQFQTLGNAPGFSLARVSVNSGYHQIVDNGGDGFVAYLYGKGLRISYGYTVGTSYRYIGDPYLVVDGENARSHPDGFDICIGDTVNFSIGGNFLINGVQWDFGNNEYSTANPTSRCYNDSVSDYNVTVRVIFTPDTNNPTLIITDTLYTTIHVHPTYNFASHDTIVQNQLPWPHGGQTFTDDCDSVPLQHQTIFGCDSIEYYTLTIWRNDTTRFDTIVCDTVLPFTWDGNTFDGPGSQSNLLQTSHGADSLIIYTLDTITCTIPPTYAYFDTTVCDTLLPIRWRDTIFYIPQTYIIKTRNVEGGDSTITITLDTVHCSLYHPRIWVPNTFTPEGDINQEFKIYHHDILEATAVIYQRWGDFVTRFDALTESWDGTKDGKPCQQGAYVYQITYRTLEHPKEVQTLFGSILLLR